LAFCGRGRRSAQEKKGSRQEEDGELHRKNSLAWLGEQKAYRVRIDSAMQRGGDLNQWEHAHEIDAADEPPAASSK
jgi:hypothetical protein